MKKIFTLRFWASIVMILTAAVMMNAQTDFSWCVIAHDNGKEVGWHSVNVITDIQLTSQSATFVLTDGKTFPYPITSTTFTFEQRAGNGTAIEVINAPKWNVYYNGSSLHFTESVNSVAVYTVSGILIAKVSGNYTDVPANLAKGIYIVQAGGKTVKLLVSSSGSGAVYAQPTAVESAPQVSYAPASSSPVTLRSANAAVYKQYWNITAGGTTMPVDISQVSSFYFTSDNTLVFIMSNGNTAQLSDYKGVMFTTQPVQTGSSKWDLVRTLEIGGASYWLNFLQTAAESRYAFMCGVGVTANGDVIGKFVNNSYITGEFKFTKNTITYPYFWEMGKLTLVYTSNKVVVLAMCQPDPDPQWALWLAYYAYNSQPSEYHDFSTYRSAYELNGGIPAIRTSITLESNGNMYMEWIDVETKKISSVELSAP